MNKIYDTAHAALADLLFDGMTIAAGGFGLCGIPETLIEGLVASEIRNITAVSNNAGVDNFGLGRLLRTRQIRRMVSSYVGENKEFERQYLAGELEIEFCPQGTLAERMRAGGAGIPGFYTRTGVGTRIAEGKDTRSFGGETYLLEHGIVADLAIVKAWKGDPYGNLVFRKSARNFNPIVASCGRVTRPYPHTRHLRAAADPGYPQREADRTAHVAPGVHLMSWTRIEMAARAARELRDGFYVNLGIGIPTLVSNHIPAGVDVTLQSENGILGLGPFPTEAEIDADIINAGKQTITELDRTSYVSSADSFGMIRGGHIHLSILGAMEVAENGDLANWMIPGKMIKGPGGAMDLVAGVKRIIVLMDHIDKTGSPKFRAKCTLPLTGANVVDMIITDLAIFERPDRHSPFRLTGLAPGTTADEVRAKTEAEYTAPGTTRG